ncbi:glycoside hydrolase family 125 protein [Sphingobacterium sp. DK4209]|uniref:Metal-independent alpha-mannosidase n=1 Tax=Sphingobacterium zhuxiongii TaxID=2662364 RepID=A0A5Q0QDV2_9SPHI|nr:MULTISPECIES: glycoside hydrolase family 125 protein [unclassified Sphingobacterium]MVZ64365.1 glycoside hydrolase family 125 protein [Sphingobacterium sp. DK4209]QGA25712.1 metal-independent alpha-mannosidase [Sphingobacterium sp. dk4302]
MKRRAFIQNSALLGAGMFASKFSFGAMNAEFPVVRTPESKRHFSSKVIEGMIKEFQKNVNDKELGWLFNNCLPNTLDTTVFSEDKPNRKLTYVITGDIDAMWLRDSSAQVWPYLAFMKKDKKLQDLVLGLINKQSECILIDPYANAFYNDPTKKGEWFSDHTAMKPGLHERKWEIDSLCYPIRLAYHYWKLTNDVTPFDDTWVKAQELIYKTFVEQQRKENLGPYKFERTTSRGTDTLQVDGYGYPVNPVGLIVSSFRPSDDCSIFPFLIPSNLFAVVSLRQSAEILKNVKKNTELAGRLEALANEVETAVNTYGIVDHPTHGRVYAFEVDGFGSYLMMDDANVPSLLALPYLGAVDVNDEVYQRTRAFILSNKNPFFFKGKAGEGIGGPHIGRDMIWPMSIIMRAFTSTDDAEIKKCVQMLKSTHGDTGFMHESFHVDDPKKFTRHWFAWTNTLFGELMWKLYKEKPHLLKA